MRRVLSGMLDLFFPPRCIFCGKLLVKGEQEICASCHCTLPRLLGRAAEQDCRSISLVVSPLQYRDMVRDSIRRYKFSGCQYYAATYGKLVADCVKEHLSGRYDLISWVPLSVKRKKERGYDQAFLLADAVARELGEVREKTLHKHRDNPPQSGLEDVADRRANVQGVYEGVNPEGVAGKRVLLLDDVITTGSTLIECAEVLRTMGAVDVVCATVARAH